MLPLRLGIERVRNLLKHKCNTFIGKNTRYYIVCACVYTNKIVLNRCIKRMKTGMYKIRRGQIDFIGNEMRLPMPHKFYKLLQLLSVHTKWIMFQYSLSEAYSQRGVFKSRTFFYSFNLHSACVLCISFQIIAKYNKFSYWYQFLSGSNNFI